MVSTGQVTFTPRVGHDRRSSKRDQTLPDTNNVIHVDFRARANGVKVLKRAA